MAPYHFPKRQGLYDPAFEKDSCGIGFIAHIKGEKTHQTVEDALTILENLSHRGARGAESRTGDGAGMLTALPHEFFVQICEKELNISLPRVGQYAVGMIFLPRIPEERNKCRRILDEITLLYGQKSIGWREVPTDNSGIGPSAKAGEPYISQVFISAADGLNQKEFERKLYLIRKQACRQIWQESMKEAQSFYVCSLSSRIVVYKGQLTAEQLSGYFPDLSNPLFKSHLAMIHSRFSTNTFPSWERAQPMRLMCHNGEINTLQGNKNWMRAREGLLYSEFFGGQLQNLFPVIEPDSSDSGNFDNVLELLIMTGRSLPEAIMMMIPEAWENIPSMSESRRAFYDFHSCLMEPWDGPASIAFTDGECIGAVLDRNGLRPSRYYVTHDDRVIMASEVGVLDILPEKILHKGRMQAGRMFLVDFRSGRIIDDEQIKEAIAGLHPYHAWLHSQRIHLSDLSVEEEPQNIDPSDRFSLLEAFGYTDEHLRIVLKPMIENAKEPLGSMGNDTPLACLSDKPRLIYDYFKQLFAQVTNPPIDSIREANVMSLGCSVGPEGNLLAASKYHCARLYLEHPFLNGRDLAALKMIDYRGWRCRTLDITYPVSEGTGGLLATLDRICREADDAIREGYALILLSDRNTDREHVPVSSLLACGAVHHHLVKTSQRTRVGLLLETGEPREVHDFCMLIGYGADAFYPYLACEAIRMTKEEGIVLSDLTYREMEENYHSALKKGMRKVLGKMGISTLQSYKGAQIFEAVGLSSRVVERCFTGTASRIEGVDFDVLAQEALQCHARGFPNRPIETSQNLPNPGEYHWRSNGEKHMWCPESIASL
ncbi:MAG TPA: glutamate synthase central domain-containing protein, partial [Spirochaetia bacterium]|nr:glutamate synthase central domain-containing protein [Spirochaetia bacterium]